MVKTFLFHYTLDAYSIIGNENKDMYVLLYISVNYPESLTSRLKFKWLMSSRDVSERNERKRAKLVF